MHRLVSCKSMKYMYKNQYVVLRILRFLYILIYKCQADKSGYDFQNSKLIIGGLLQKCVYTAAKEKNKHIQSCQLLRIARSRVRI